MKTRFLFPFIFLFVLAASCEKENPEPFAGCIDRPRCEGCSWNVFRCKVNGKEWCANCESGSPIFGCDPVDCQYYPESKTLEIRTGNHEKNDGFSFRVYRSVVVGENIPITFSNSAYFNRNYSNACRQFKLDTINGSYVRLDELNEVEKIIEATFAFTAINDCQDTVRVTDGYFKLTYRP